ncbi:MAG: 50S ribosomal protein L13 [Patescibacteria group bacterium]
MFKQLRTTKRPKPAELSEKWYLVNAAGKNLGRLATALAKVLIGKTSATFDPAVLIPTKIVVINAAEVKITGKKLEQKKYYRHSGYTGGLKTTLLGDLMEKNPTLVLQKAVSGMLPKNKLRRLRLANLKIYADDQHPHIAQKPVNLEL